MDGILKQPNVTLSIWQNAKLQLFDVRLITRDSRHNVRI